MDAYLNLNNCFARWFFLRYVLRDRPQISLEIKATLKDLARFYLPWKYHKNLMSIWRRSLYRSGLIFFRPLRNASKNIVKAFFLPISPDIRKPLVLRCFQGVKEENNICWCIAKWPEKKLKPTYTEIFSKST